MDAGFECASAHLDHQRGGTQHGGDAVTVQAIRNEAIARQGDTLGIDVAVENEKAVIGVKLDKDYSTPVNLRDVGAKWARSFDFDAIKRVIYGI